MKTIKMISKVFLFVLLSCNSNVKPMAHKVTFGIYETVKISELPKSIMDSLKTLNIQLEKNTQSPIIGFIPIPDSSACQLDFTRENFRLLKTIYTVDPEKKYFAIIAVKSKQVIDNSDIQNTKPDGSSVEIYFNLAGAKKWANLTKKNIGNTIAFVIDNQIYSLPRVKGEIKNGCALINGLENEAMAKNISESLNSGIPE